MSLCRYYDSCNLYPKIFDPAKKIISRTNGQHSGSSLLTTIAYLAAIFVDLFFALIVLQLDRAVFALHAGV